MEKIRKENKKMEIKTDLKLVEYQNIQHYVYYLAVLDEIIDDYLPEFRFHSK